eukprot:gnl/Spiro4/27944_TR13834_c0_g1_i1.p1 gnl/Spiro4/27944_TR13834_c0_g1~~gnl/Spiro4/27944_TR13834_c0_g1_i1.p1  ORF type:complete len:292 (+),score=65.23 gnl/Spiro4/27944_TR13834_c0_g1_i1:66-878(+)
MAASPRIVTTVQNHIAFVKLNRPDKLNSLDFEMFSSIRRTIRDLSKDRTLRAVVVSGEGSDFSSGLDVKSVAKKPLQMFSLLLKWRPSHANLAQEVAYGWRRVPVPVIAAIHGRCYGGALQIALGADVRVVHPDAQLSVMEVKWGLIPDMAGTVFLRELIRKDQALELTMTGRVFSGTEAAQMGIATYVNADPVAEATRIAEQIADRSPDAVAAAKRMFNKNWNSSEGSALARETWYQIAMFLSPNRRVSAQRALTPDSKSEYRPRQWWW